MTRERGYARVSTLEQSVDSQVRALVDAGVPVEGNVTEAGSGRGYARVSTLEQSVDSQVRALVDAGVSVEGIVTEAGSGRGSRPGLERLLAELGEGTG